MDPDLHILEISYETLRRLAHQLDLWELTRRRWGRRTADRRYRATGAGVITHRPLERVEVDHFLLDAFLLVAYAGGFLRYRAWLTVAIDHYSGVVLGYHLSFAPPSTTSVLAVLRKAILPATATAPAIRDGHEPPSVFGIPDCIVVDNGLDLTSYGTRDACFALGIEVLYCPPRVPWYKGTVERFGRTINQRLVHWLPGTTLGKPLRDVDYDPKKHACILAEDFEGLFDYYVTHIHNYSPRRGKRGTPLQRWQRGIAQFPPRLPASAEAFDAALALTRSAKLTKRGVHFAYRDYNSAALGRVWNRIGDGQKVVLKVNPLDLTKLAVIDPTCDEPMSVPCTTPFSYPAILDYHSAVCQFARERDLDPNNAEHLSRCEQALRDETQEAILRGKRALRRAQVHFADLARKAAASDPGPFEPPAAERRDEVEDLLRTSRPDNPA